MHLGHNPFDVGCNRLACRCFFAQSTVLPSVPLRTVTTHVESRPNADWAVLSNFACRFVQPRLGATDSEVLKPLAISRPQRGDHCRTINSRQVVAQRAAVCFESVAEVAIGQPVLIELCEIDLRDFRRIAWLQLIANVDCPQPSDAPFPVRPVRSAKQTGEARHARLNSVQG